MRGTGGGRGRCVVRVRCIIEGDMRSAFRLLWFVRRKVCKCGWCNVNSHENVWLSPGCNSSVPVVRSSSRVPSAKGTVQAPGVGGGGGAVGHRRFFPSSRLQRYIRRPLQRGVWIFRPKVRIWGCVAWAQGGVSWGLVAYVPVDAYNGCLPSRRARHSYGRPSVTMR